MLILVFTRALGKRELSSLQPFDIVLLVVIGDLIQQGVTQNDLSVTGVFIVLSTIGLAQVTTSYLSFRSRRLRPLLAGEPLLLIDNGRILERNLWRERVTHADLAEAARRNEIDAGENIKWAVLET